MENCDVLKQASNDSSNVTTTDEILQDGTKVRTLESATATIRFCFIDDKSTDEDDDDAGEDNANADIHARASHLYSSDEEASSSTACDLTSPLASPVSINHMDPAKTRIDDSVNGNSGPLQGVDNFKRQNSIIDEEQIDEGVNSDIGSSLNWKSNKLSSTNASDDKQKTLRNSGETFNGARKKTPSISSQTSQTSLSSGSSRPPSSERFNPFNTEMNMEDDHFSSNSPSKTESRPKLLIKTTPSTSSSSGADDFVTSVDEDDFVFAHLGLHEDYFSSEGHFGLSTGEELEMAINHCKDLIVKTGENEEKKQSLVQKLVQLRIKLQETKEGPQEVAADVKLVMGHHFQRQDTRSVKNYCEKCVNVIWGVIQIWYQCRDCGYSCHSKCLGSMTRMCALTKIQESPNYIMSIRPEKGLDAQQYRCSECRALISFKSSTEEPRQCDYNGSYYCSLCHWNDTAIIPARVIHNWDFTQYKVCRASKQYLRLMQTRPIISIQQTNHMLFSFVEELSEIKRLRQEILMMKQYFLSCPKALESKLLLQLSHRQHFVDNADKYSLQDLMDLELESLLPELCKIHTTFAQHIKTDCELCQGKGHFCEICYVHEAIFPFDNHVIVCDQCQAVLHKHCFRKKEGLCPRCVRKKAKPTESKPKQGQIV